ncbi:MAG: tRNA (N(6)-L-threonylcarbamoyladenosine(37)-C(2))-methylthiotransferase MtaB [Candidatus Zixiibacteriota bacterium]
MSAPRRVSFYTLGCRLNQAETALMAESFRQQGYGIAEHGTPVDVAVINTCSVTERADARCRNEIRKIRRRSPNAIVCAVGCYAQADTDTVASILGVNLVVGTDKKYALAELVERYECGDSPGIHVNKRPDTGGFEYPAAGFYSNLTRANIKIQDGCDFCCAFCLLPRVRGDARSRRLGDIVAEGYELARRGHKELIIAGVNIGTYAFEEFTIADVARSLSDIPGIERVRVSSIEPTTVSDDLLEWMATSPKACRHLHLPLQSGDDSVLKGMKRVYTTRDYAQFVDKAMRLMPDLGLGTDVIVGFPGEGEREFANSMRFIEQMPFSYLHVFSYSERPKTAAVYYDDKVPPPVIKERSNAMHAIGDRKKKAFFERHIGRDVEVLFESVDSDGWRKGFTGSYLRVGVDPSAVNENEIATVHLFGSADGFVLGETRKQQAMTA